MNDAVPSSKNNTEVHGFPSCVELAALALCKPLLDDLLHKIKDKQRHKEANGRPTSLAVYDVFNTLPQVIHAYFYENLPFEFESKLIPRVVALSFQHLVDGYVGILTKAQHIKKGIGELYLLATREKEGSQLLANAIKAKYPYLVNQVNKFPSCFVTDTLIQYAVQWDVPLLKSLVASRVYVARAITYAAAYHRPSAKECVR